jgi:hypothetical protein
MKKITLLASLLIVVLSVKSQTFKSTIERNNVKAFVASGGLLFNDLGNGKGGFNVPKGANNKDLISIYSSSLWLGAIDNGNNIHIAAQTYRQSGLDFKVGPLDLSGDFNDYDFLWRINKKDVDSLIKFGKANDRINLWPGTYKSLNGDKTLAPFFDKDANGIYNPANGDYPIFPGDEALFFVYNDDTIHTETVGMPLGFQIHGFVYQYVSNNNDFLNNTVFVDYYITNKSANEYSLVNTGVWTDFDLGFYADDRIGTDINRNMYYAYNEGDSDDIYGKNPPAIGVTFLNIPLSTSIRYNNDFSASGNPTVPQHYYNYLNGLWKDGTSMKDLGDGYNSGGNVTKFAFSGNPCSQTGWTETSGGVSAGDRRMLGSASFNNFKPNDVKKITVAYTWSRSNLGGSIPSLCKLFSQVDSLKDWFNNQPPLSTPTVSNIQAKVYPNPASQNVTVEVAYNNTLHIELYDITGKQILTTNNNTFSVSQLAKGLYIIKGKADNRFFTKKLQVE